MRCPYPDCCTQMSAVTVKSTAGTRVASRIDHIADQVHLCRDCGRLVFLCVANDCQKALNRPFSRFCRQCGKSQYPANGELTASDRWHGVQRFDFDWSFAVTPTNQKEQIPGNVSAAAQQVVCGLNNIKGFRPPKELMELAFIDGLLAIHQGGGFFALLHPFREGLETSDFKSVIWSQSEQELCKLPDRDDTLHVFRPYTPIATSDRRFAIFSTPYAVFSVQLGTLPGWNYQAETKSSLVWSTNSLSQQRLAARPVLLKNSQFAAPGEPASGQVSGQASDQNTDQNTDQNQLGLLLYCPLTQQYSWLVISLDVPRQTTATNGTADLQKNEIPLNIQGNPIQILPAEDQFLVFATSAGHWIWSTADAAQMNSQSMFQARTQDDRNDILLNAEVVDRGVFSRHYQHLVAGKKRSDPQFELCYTRQPRGGQQTIERRNIWPTNPNATNSAESQRIDTFGKITSTIGDCRCLDDPLEREMLFLVDSKGSLFRRPFTGGNLRPLGNIETGEITTMTGFRFFDPLLVTIRVDPSNLTQQTVELRSIRQPQSTAFASQLSLKSDPLPWSNYLFTCEQHQGEIAILRRQYSIGSNGPVP